MPGEVEDAKGQSYEIHANTHQQPIQPLNSPMNETYVRENTSSRNDSP